MKPSSNNRWEASAYITTPHPDYEIIGLSSHYSADEKEPSLNVQINWPENQVGMRLGADFQTENLYKGHFQMKLPFQQLKNFAIDGSISPLVNMVL